MSCAESNDASRVDSWPSSLRMEFSFKSEGHLAVPDMVVTEVWQASGSDARGRDVIVLRIRRHG